MHGELDKFFGVEPLMFPGLVLEEEGVTFFTAEKCNW